MPVYAALHGRCNSGQIYKKSLTVGISFRRRIVPPFWGWFALAFAPREVEQAGLCWTVEVAALSAKESSGRSPGMGIRQENCRGR